MFTIHNETLNVWTHLVGFLLFLFLTIYTAMKVPGVVDLNSLPNLRNMLQGADWHKIQEELLSCLPSITNMPDPHRIKDVLQMSLPSMDFLTSLSACLKDDVVNMVAPLTAQAIPRWPFFTFLGGAMFCLLASSTCHLLCCHSERLSYIMLRLDYAGIAALISTSFYPPIYYSFMCYPLFRNLYMGFITVLGVATIIISLLPVFQKPKFRSFRASLFFGMGVSGIAPVLHKLILFRDKPEAVQTTGYEILMGMLYGCGALIYATRIPERWKPGKFDIAGHSHQLFHVLVVAGAYTHYLAGLVYLRWRDLEGC
ncbi:Heptahelical transmembrane protein [Melia azedarach]|nr:Heptahelical transmembrane protein [Melia azedarach]